MEVLLGFNAVEAALQAERRTVDRVYVEKGRDRARLARLKALAARHSVPVEEVDRARLERLAGRQPRSAHQGVLAAAAARPYEDPHRLVESCGRQAIVLVVDGVEDPRNLGALIRTAAGAGAAAVFIPERRAAGLTATAARASAGATERLPVARVGNIAVFMKYLKEQGFWTIGLDAGAQRPWDGISYPAKLALVVGGEGAGIRRLVRDTCDELVCLPLERGVESLNVSVATGICLYEALRQRRAATGGEKVP